MDTTYSILYGVCAFLVFLKLYVKISAGVCRSKRSIEGKTVIVTGANTGIGLETARDLAKRKARVILACRSLERGNKAARDIRETTGNQNVVVRQLDLSSMASVRQFAEETNSTEERLDVLVHNAGVIPRPGKHMTVDNLELQFATNHFGPFLLTHLLLDLLKRSAPSRIVVVSSSSHKYARLDLGNLNYEKYAVEPYITYGSTKLANILFSRELHDRLAGTEVTVNALEPGAVDTIMARGNRWFMMYIAHPIGYFFKKSPQMGAQTSIYLAVSEEVEGMSGKYFIDCHETKPSSAARDKKLAIELWELSERLTGISKE